MERLRRFLIDARMTQKQFAKRLGVSQPTVSDWLSGKMPPSVQNLRKISALTGLSIDEILCNEAA